MDDPHFEKECHHITPKCESWLFYVLRAHRGKCSVKTPLAGEMSPCSQDRGGVTHKTGGQVRSLVLQLQDVSVAATEGSPGGDTRDLELEC